MIEIKLTQLSMMSGRVHVLFIIVMYDEYVSYVLSKAYIPLNHMSIVLQSQDVVSKELDENSYFNG